MADSQKDHNSSQLVSVVIPTRGRPRMLMKAVESALKQTYSPIEVIVVVDGPDDATIPALKGLVDERLHIVALTERVGGSDTRNIGVHKARGEWVAFLDDDDEWLQDKIEVQLKRANESKFNLPIVCSRVIARSQHCDFTWPRKAPSEPLSEYLFTRHSLSYGEGMILPTTVLTRRELMTQVPFCSGLPKFQDADWVLRAVRHPGVGIEFVNDPTAIWNIHDSVQRVTTSSNWEFSLHWVRERRELFTPRAYASFLLTICAAQAAAEHSPNAFWELIEESFQSGSPRPFDFVLYLQAWLAPMKWAQRLWSILCGRPPLLLVRQEEKAKVGARAIQE